MRVSLGLLLYATPVILPASIRPQDAQGQHLTQVFHLPPRSGDLQPDLNNITMGALDLPRTDGQIRRYGTSIIKELGVVGEVAVAGADRSLAIRHAVALPERPQAVQDLRPAILLQ